MIRSHNIFILSSEAPRVEYEQTTCEVVADKQDLVGGDIFKA